jgi:hypothetical protein
MEIIGTHWKQTGCFVSVASFLNPQGLGKKPASRN